MSILMLTLSNVLPETSCYELIYHMTFLHTPASSSINCGNRQARQAIMNGLSNSKFNTDIEVCTQLSGNFRC